MGQMQVAAQKKGDPEGDIRIALLECCLRQHRGSGGEHRLTAQLRDCVPLNLSHPLSGDPPKSTDI